MSKHRFDHTVDHSDDIKPERQPARLQRIEVITGVERRRTWSSGEKLSMVAESLADGAVVSEVARRHGISPQQLFGWRAKVRAEMVAVAGKAPPAFVPAIADGSSGDATTSCASDIRRPDTSSEEGGSIEITLGRARVRVRGAVDPRALTAVLKALKVRS